MLLLSRHRLPCRLCLFFVLFQHLTGLLPVQVLQWWLLLFFSLSLASSPAITGRSVSVNAASSGKKGQQATINHIKAHLDEYGKVAENVAKQVS